MTGFSNIIVEEIIVSDGVINHNSIICVKHMDNTYIINIATDTIVI